MSMRSHTIVGLLLIAAAIGLAAFDRIRRAGKGGVQSEPDLAMARQAHPTRLTRHGPSPGNVFIGHPPPKVKEVQFPSGNLWLRAWIADDFGRDGKLQPAVVFLHGGFGFRASEWELAKMYFTTGAIVFAPMLRGENGNPGEFEQFWGEVNDAVAAGKYAARLQGVDTSAIFLVGHGAGGTLAMLAAMHPSPFRAVVAVGGSVDQKAIAAKLDPSIRAFDINDAEEIRLRSPIRCAASIQCPLYLFSGGADSSDIDGMKALAAEAKKLGKTCEFSEVSGDQKTMGTSEVNASVDIFQRYIGK